MRRTDDASLWPWPFTFDVETGAPSSTCRGIPSCQCCWYYDYSLAIYGLLGVGVSVWGATSPLWIDHCSSKLLLLRDGGNGQITVIFRRKKSRFRQRFRKFGTVAMLWSLIRILRASLVQIDTEMAEKYAEQQHPGVCGNLASDMPQDVCQH